LFAPFGGIGWMIAHPAGSSSGVAACCGWTSAARNGVT